MEILYGKRFSKDLDGIRHEAKVKQALLALIESLKAADSPSDLKDVRKIQGYQGYFRVKLGDHRLEIKAEEKRVELIRFLHRKDIYRRFPGRNAIGHTAPIKNAPLGTRCHEISSTEHLATSVQDPATASNMMLCFPQR
jgi:mRNA interferase RelE/StbE